MFLKKSYARRRVTIRKSGVVGGDVLGMEQRLFLASFTWPITDYIALIRFDSGHRTSLNWRGIALCVPSFAWSI
jgi:hypothetical protein